MSQRADHAEPKSVHRPDGLFAAVPIVLVNLLAVVGQTQWAGTHLHWNLAGRILFAGALESTALAVLYYSHRTLLEGDSTFRLRIGAYAIAAGAGAVNWQEHAGPHWEATPNAFVFAGASFASPLLWQTYSRYASRTAMREAGLLDRRAAKFSAARWFWFPIRTFRAFRYSVWESVQSPADAIAGVEARRRTAAELVPSVTELVRQTWRPDWDTGMIQRVVIGQIPDAKPDTVAKAIRRVRQERAELDSIAR